MQPLILLEARMKLQDHIALCSYLRGGLLFKLEPCVYVAPILQAGESWSTKSGMM
jgi:hypothetical protein